MFVALLFTQAQFDRPVVLSPSSLPKRSKSIIKKPVVVPRPHHSGLKLPTGFKANVFAKGLKSPRWLLALPNGDVLCVECYQGRILLLRDGDGDGSAETRAVFASGLNLPFGLALQGGFLYVANTNSVVRFPYKSGQTQASGKPETVIANIPSLGYNMHWTRNLAFSPDGHTLYVTVGSETNRDVEKSPRGTIQAYDTKTWRPGSFATGLRNPVGLAFRPGTGELWATCVERDYMGEDLVPDFVTRVSKGDFFGWPWFYIGKNRDARVKNPPSKPVRVPDVLITAHSVPLGLLFYTGTMFPEAYRGDLFVAMRGSTNRVKMAGYQVVRIDFKDGVRSLGYRSFVEGFIPDRTKPQVYGRPVGLAQMQDGSMLIADEAAHMIWRITY